MIKKEGYLKIFLAKKEYVFLTLILLIALSLQLASLMLSTQHDLDFYRFLNRSSLVMDGNIPFRDFSDPKPVWTYTLAAWQQIFGNTEENALIFLITIHLLTIIILFFIGKKIYGSKGGYMTALFYGLAPFTILFSSAEGKMDMIPILFVLLSFLFLINEKYIPASILMGIGIAYKYLAGLLLIPFIILIIMTKNKKTSIHFSLICCATTFLITLPFILISSHDFINDTFLFFMTRENTGYGLGHPYNYVPFIIPILLATMGLVFITLHMLSIKKVNVKNIITFSFFFIMIANLFNRVLFTQYLLYAIPFLSLYMTEVVIEKKQPYRLIFLFSIPFVLGGELLNNFGFTTVETMSIIGDVTAFTWLWLCLVTVYLFIDWDKTLMNNKQKNEKITILNNG
jgi:4-amino-4-deoxy-L-arabinose transferase-like glycosyltransferase